MEGVHRTGGIPLSEIRRLLLEFELENVARLANKTAKYKKALVKSFSDPSEIVRERALLASIDMADPTLVDDIVNALNDEDADVRIACAQALAWYQQPKTVPYMLRGLLDENPWVRSHCAAGLSKMLEGPIWARIPKEDIKKIIDGFPNMTDEEIASFLTSLNLVPDAINRLVRWHKENFELDIDDSILMEELEGKPIILESAEGTLEPITPPTHGSTTSEPEISPEVQLILSELPEDIVATLPPEDLRRLTPSSARELVEKLKDQLGIEEEPPKKKKKVKVRKVKRVKKKKKGPTRSQLLKKIPKSVRDSVGEEALQSLTVEELEALIAASPEEEVERPKEKPKKEPEGKLAELIAKYGEEKAEILIKLPEDMLSGLGKKEIEEMDLDTLQSLVDALGPPE